MFEPRQLPQFGTARAGASAAVLAPAQADPASGRLAALAGLAGNLFDHLNSSNWAPDLAEEIGSARWFRGLGTLVGLVLAGIALGPDFQAVAAPPAMPLDANAREEFRSQMIQPLALGGDTGRRMGATLAAVPSAGVPVRNALKFTATLGQGDSFERMLARAGLGAEDAAAVGRLVAGAIPLDQIQPGTQFDIALGTSETGQRQLDRLDFRARFDLDLSVSRSGGQLALQSHPITVDTTPLRIRGTVGTSLYMSARAAGAPIEAIQEYLSVLDQHMSLDSAIEPGDTFDIIVSYRRASSGETQVGELLFAGLEHGGQLKAQLLRWGKEGQFFEASGMGQQRSGLIMPVVGGRITSNFGARRHPILGYTRMHAGIDFGAAYGSPIYAVSDGNVIFSGWHGGHGNYVKLDHGGGFATGYGHMSRIAVGAGGHVRAGQVIGYVGSTGLSTGPHLHYELYRNGTPVNPLTVSFTVTQQVDPGELAAYKARMAQLKTVKPGAAMQSLAPRQASVGPGVQRREIDKLGN
ncbi:MAG: peptidoglycan DD-metalloendopeptidase family protein [Sphingomonadaceae bacterium]